MTLIGHHAYQVDWGFANQPAQHFTPFIIFAENPEDADLRAREVLSTKSPGKYVYTVLRVVRSGAYEVLPTHSGE